MTEFVEGIHAPIVVKADDGDHDLEIRFDGTCMDFYLDGKEVFGGDWDGNVKQLFELALKKWGDKK